MSRVKGEIENYKMKQFVESLHLCHSIFICFIQPAYNSLLAVCVVSCIYLECLLLVISTTIRGTSFPRTECFFH